MMAFSDEPRELTGKKLSTTFDVLFGFLEKLNIDVSIRIRQGGEYQELYM